jgi:hypothetical protein
MSKRKKGDRPVIIQGGTTNPLRSRIQRKRRKRRTGGVK